LRSLALALILACPLTAVLPQNNSDGPATEKAQKAYKEALEALHKRMPEEALGKFRKADKEDGGHCLACWQMMIKYGVEFRDWKTAETAAEEMLADAKGEKNVAIAHYLLGSVVLRQGMETHKDDRFARAHEELSKAIAASPRFPEAVFADGKALAHLKQDEAAKQRFEQFVKMRPSDDPDRLRALRYIQEPELARARMAPQFSLTTTDGQNFSLDDLRGKVVLIDFWATWCTPCREAVPHMREIAKKFQGQPLVILSVSLDTDEQKWEDFIAKNGMTWPQYRDGGFTGPIARLFSVEAIPHTFTIDADGVLQDEHIGDAAIEGKLKKLAARAVELQAAAKPGQ
jgi:peroxiredoxin